MKFSKETLTSSFPSSELAEWKHVSGLLEFCSYWGRDWLFRGASKASYPLIPKIGRDERKKKSGSRIAYSKADEVAVLDFFKSRATAVVSDTKRSEIEWMALAQHHGAPTRLLDWSEGLLVALWFATQTSKNLKSSDDGAGALWLAWDLPKASEATRNNPLNARQVGTYRPDYFDRRIAAQLSVFTLQQSPTVPLQTENLFMLRVPNASKFTLRKRLDAAGINERTIFPGLSGLGADVAWRYKNNFLQKYQREEP